jgi:hypothetical protein
VSGGTVIIKLPAQEFKIVKASVSVPPSPPPTQSIITVSNESATLVNSRRATAGPGIVLTDAGAGQAFTIAAAAKTPYALQRKTSVGQCDYGCYASSVDAHFFFDQSASGKMMVFDAGSGVKLTTVTNAKLASPRGCVYVPSIDRVMMMDSTGDITTVNPSTYAVVLDNVSPWSGGHAGFSAGEVNLIYNPADGYVYCTLGITAGLYRIIAVDPSTGSSVHTYTLDSGLIQPYTKDCSMALGTDGNFYIIGSNSANNVSQLTGSSYTTLFSGVPGTYGSNGAIALGGPNNDIYLLSQELILRRYNHAGVLQSTHQLCSTGGFILCRYDSVTQILYIVTSTNFIAFDCVANKIVGVFAGATLTSSIFSTTNQGLSFDNTRKVLVQGNDTDGVTFVQG